ncbi:MAG: hypothetical protein EOM24_21765 [Chloroflexia bacterium]|nr:hypothetical protein [Chloroflexia bacterium]
MEARHAYARARALTPDADVLGRARLQRAIGNSWRTQGILDEAEQAYARALRSLSERPQQQEDPPYWQEMIAVYFDQINLQLWQGGQGEATEQCLTSLDWILERHGAPPQIAHAAHLALVAEWWRCSGNIDSTFLTRGDRALQLCETCGDRWLAARARWNIGMMQVLHGDATRADALLQLALVDTAQVGDIQLHIRGLVVIGLLARRRGQIEAVQTNALTYLPQAQHYHLQDCVGAGYANLAWAAWRTEDRTRAEEYARHALAAWRASTIAYPLQWTALWPLVAVTLATDQVGEAISAARHLLHPLQQRPPEPLATMLCAAISAYEQDQPDAAHAHMQVALSEAQAAAFL